MPSVDIRALSEVTDLHLVTDLVAEVWGVGDGQRPVTPALLRALASAGGYVAGAFSTTENHLVGTSIALLGRDALHSHITAVRPSHQGAGIGAELKWHQREWALQAGFSTVVWTFDPLVTRNARFNVVRLGAEVTAYHPDFYGPMDDAVNVGDLTDRCVASWPLRSARVTRAWHGIVDELDTDALGADAQLALDADERGEPIELDARGSVRLCRVPAFVPAARADDPGLARRWRLAVRRVLGGALDAGFHVEAVTADGCYVLRGPG